MSPPGRCIERCARRRLEIPRRHDRPSVRDATFSRRPTVASHLDPPPVPLTKPAIPRRHTTTTSGTSPRTNPTTPPPPPPPPPTRRTRSGTARSTPACGARIPHGGAYKISSGPGASGGYDALAQRPDGTVIAVEPGYERPAIGPTTNFVGNHMTQGAIDLAQGELTRADPDADRRRESLTSREARRANHHSFLSKMTVRIDDEHARIVTARRVPSSGTRGGTRRIRSP